MVGRMTNAPHHRRPGDPYRDHIAAVARAARPYVAPTDGRVGSTSTALELARNVVQVLSVVPEADPVETSRVAVLWRHRCGWLTVAGSTSCAGDMARAWWRVEARVAGREGQVAA